MSRRAPIALMVAVVLAAGSAAACSSSGKGGGGGTGSGTAPATSGGTATGGGGGSGKAAAQARVDALLKAPTSINITTPVSKKPAAGKTIALVESAEPVTIKTNDGFRAAAKAIGWTVKTVQEGSGPEDPAKAFGQAIDMHPDAICITGNPLSTMRAQVARAKAAKIPVIQSDAGEPAGQDGSIYTLSLDNFVQTGAWGNMIADYISTKGSKHTLVVDLSVYPILHAFSTAVVKQLKTVSPSTKTTILDTQISDLAGGKIAGNIVSQVQRNPDIDWVILALGDMATGLDAALRGAGLANKVKIGGESASTANITALKKNQQAVWTGFAAAIHGWRRIDALVRIFNGDSLDPNNNSKLPTQLLTPDNVKQATLDPDGYYVGVPDYQTQYKKLWLVG
ncbi:MAG TPA: substrate-binding domain-containing protein [Jatrophihabitans sp.]|nr:substrate-binding domain-containing protein [Jatrophihabitans sp.]